MEAPLEQTHIQQLLNDNFGLTVITARQTGRGHYNSTFRVTTTARTGRYQQQEPLQHGCVPIAPEEEHFILHAVKRQHGDGVITTIENKVAMTVLFANALQQLDIVPTTYGWGQLNGVPWMLRRCMSGVPARDILATSKPQQQQHILHQLADIVAKIRNYEIPREVAKYGGVKWDDHGHLVSTPSILTHQGPFQSLYESVVARFVGQIQVAEKNCVTQGWSEHGLMSRLKVFVTQKLCKYEDLLASQGLMLVHGSIDLDNIFIDEKTYRVTGLTHFDFSRIGSPLDEFLESFSSVFGTLPGAFEEEDDLLRLRDCHLHGFAKPLSAERLADTQTSDHRREFGDDMIVDWALAEMWYATMRTAGVSTPSDMPAAQVISALHWFVEDICPFYFCQEGWKATQSAETVERTRDGCKRRLEKYLDQF